VAGDLRIREVSSNIKNPGLVMLFFKIGENITKERHKVGRKSPY
jgi:hypothetical protein